MTNSIDLNLSISAENQPGVALLGEYAYSQLVSASRQDPRGRSHLSLHHAPADACQRLLVAMQTRSYLRPHRHASPPKDKCYVALKGRLGVLWFDDQGAILGRQVLIPQGPLQIGDLAAGVWHTILALTPDSLFLEVKPGPYVTLDTSDLAAWAPDPSDPQAAVFLDSLYSQFD